MSDNEGQENQLEYPDTEEEATDNISTSSSQKTHDTSETDCSNQKNLAPERKLRWMDNIGPNRGMYFF